MAESLGRLRPGSCRGAGEGSVELPDLARALLFAARKVPSRTASPKEIEEALEEIRGPREDMLNLAELSVGRGPLDKQRVADFRKGTGKFDMAEDGMSLAVLYHHCGKSGWEANRQDAKAAKKPGK